MIVGRLRSSLPQVTTTIINKTSIVMSKDYASNTQVEKYSGLHTVHDRLVTTFLMVMNYVSLATIVRNRQELG